MRMMVSQMTNFTIVNSIVCSGADQRKYQSSTSLAFVRGIHCWPVNSLHKGPVTRKMVPFDDVIMWWPVFCLTLCNYLNQCWFILTSALGNKCQQNWNQKHNFRKRKWSPAKWWPFYLGLPVLVTCFLSKWTYFSMIWKWLSHQP